MITYMTGFGESLCAHILRVRYETLPEWRGLIKAQQETVRVENYDPQVIADAFERGQKAGNRARRIIQVGYWMGGLTRLSLFLTLTLTLTLKNLLCLRNTEPFWFDAVRNSLRSLSMEWTAGSC